MTVTETVTSAAPTSAALEFNVDAQVFKKALAAVKPAIAGRGYRLPVLGGVRLAVDGEDLTVTATDLDLTIVRVLDGIHVDVSGVGPVVLPHKLLHDSVKGKGRVTVSFDGEKATLTTQNGMTTIVPVLPAEEFPKMPEPAAGDTLQRAGNTILLDVKAVAAVLPAVAKGDDIPIIASAFFDGDSIVGTDRYRLHIATVPGADYPNMLVPRPTLAALADTKDGPVRVVTPDKDARDVTFFADSTTWTSRLTEGDFPDYKRLIPQAEPTSVTIDRNVLLAALEAMKPLVPAKNTTPLRIYIKPDKVDLVIVQQDGPGCEMSVPATNEGGDEVEAIGFNVHYLTDIIKSVITGDTVTLSRFADPMRPAVMSEVDAAGRTFTGVLMPVRL